MISPTPISSNQVMNHVNEDEPLIPGLYSWSEQDWDDEDLETWNHNIGYANDDEFLWTITDETERGMKVYLSIRKVHYREAYDVNKEEFFSFVKKNTPDAMEWLFFNLDLLG